MRINVGVISFAHGHVGVYCNQMKNWDDVRLVAAWDDDQERGQDPRATTHPRTMSRNRDMSQEMLGGPVEAPQV